MVFLINIRTGTGPLTEAQRDRAGPAMGVLT
jgi:hypothetical protein